MNPIDWLKQLFAPPTMQQKVDEAKKGDIPPWLDSLYKSPLADSLYKTSGIPTMLSSFLDPKKYSTLYGDYDFGWDALRMNRDKSRYDPVDKKIEARMDVNDPRSVFIHEMGHKFNSGGPAFQPTNRLPFPESYYAKDTPLGKSSLALNHYYTKNSMEGAAQAFLNAWNFLDKTKDPKVDYRKLAGDLESQTPGMGQIITNLLGLEIFDKHPLKGKAFIQAQKK